MIDISPIDKTLLITLCLVTLWLAESFAPIIIDRKKRIQHNSKNLFIGIIGSVTGAIFYTFILINVFDFIASNAFGLTYWLQLEGIALFLFAFIAFDCWQYIWHVINHKIPFLWRFHQVHHADKAMDVSTGVCFHFGEILLSMCARVFVIAIIGMSVEQLIIYELLSLPVILFHHSNIRVPTTLSKVLGLFIVTPAIHWVHHSHQMQETDSNYASFLSIWDRLFGTAKAREQTDSIATGITEIKDTDFMQLMLLPFSKNN